jgi:hypothetical protein
LKVQGSVFQLARVAVPQVLRKSLGVPDQPQQEIVRLDKERRVGYRKLRVHIMWQFKGFSPRQRSEYRVPEIKDDLG